MDCIPKSGVLFSGAFLVGGILSALFRNGQPFLHVLFWFLLHVITVYIYDYIHREGGNPLYYAMGKMIRTFYRLYYQIEGFKNHDISCLHKEMSFSLEQTKYMQKREIAMFSIYLITFIVMLLSVCIWRMI